MHFCVSTARWYGRVPGPRNTSLNWFMPALVNSSVGSSRGTTLLDGTAVWPCFLTKKSINCWRMSLALSISNNLDGYCGRADRSLALAAYLLEQEHALFVGDDNVRQLVAVEVGDDELCTDAGIIINQVRHELGDAIGAALRFEPEE